jgi:hypothetical protein
VVVESGRSVVGVDAKGRESSSVHLESRDKFKPGSVHFLNAPCNRVGKKQIGPAKVNVYQTEAAQHLLGSRHALVWLPA